MIFHFHFHVFAESLQIVVAAGPYTLSDTLSYQPWEDLSDYVIKNKPHVLILIGPVIDCLHPLVADNSICEPFLVFFERQLSYLLNRLQE
jgi:DNA polymerase alpha subunit B